MTFWAQGNDRNQEQTEDSMDSVSQVQTRAYIKILPRMPQIAIVQYGGNANFDIRLWNMDTHERARKDDQISAKNGAPPRRPNKEKIQTKSTKRKEQRWRAEDWWRKLRLQKKPKII